MAPSKSKEKKEKKEPNKTNRRSKSTDKTKNPAAHPVAEGQAPAELADQLGKAKNRQQLYDMIKGHAAGSIPEFLKFVPESARLPVPIRDGRRVRVGADEEFFPGQYVRMEGVDYIIVQAPTQKNYGQIWKIIQQDRIRLMVCLCHDEQIGKEDSKCFPYFPTESEQSIEVEQKKGTFTIVCKKSEGLSMGAMKYELDITDSEAVMEKSGDDPKAAENGKTRRITLFHMNTWNGQKPDSGNPFEMAQNVAHFFREVKKHEIGILRQSMENFVPPVMIQSFDGINRSAIGWVALMLLRDVEKRECFDVPNLMKTIMKCRLGSLSTYYQFSFCMAVCLSIGKEVKWCENDCNSALNDLTSKFGDRKLNELGNLA
ncbi:unnamed protein product [Caenorhabditis brenneri]